MSTLPCEQVRDSFSDLLDGPPPPVDAGLGDVLAHLDACAHCRRDFDSFCDAVAKLRSHALPPADESTVRAIVDRVAAARPAARVGKDRSAWRRAAAHLVSAGLGAAAAVLLMLHGSPESARDPALLQVASAERPEADPETPPEPARADTGVRVRFASGQGTILRDGKAETLAGTATFYPGETIEIAGAEPRVVLVPKVSVIEQRAPWMALRLDEVDVGDVRFVLTSSLSRVRDSLGRMRETLRAAARPVASAAGDARSGRTPFESARPASRDADANPPAPRRDAATDLARSPGPAAAVRAVPAESTAPVVVRREDGRVRIETRGPLADVVPRLIALLHGGDPVVERLVVERLRMIRADLERDGELRAAFARSDAALLEKTRAVEAPDPWSRLFGGRDEEPRPEPTPAVIWSHWWERNAVAIASARSHGTF